jgi:uncharacterized protein YdaU (DUF1376 family)
MKKHYYWMPVNVGDWIRDIEHLTPAETGAYFRLIMFYWSNGGLPKSPDGTNDEIAIARITRLDTRSWRRSRHVLRAMFRDPASWTHSRVDTELAKAIEKSRVNSANASAKRKRNGSENGGNYNYKYNKKEAFGEKPKLEPGFKAAPASAEFEKWKAWAFQHNVPLWRELLRREEEGRAFEFETQWPH